MAKKKYKGGSDAKLQDKVTGFSGQDSDKKAQENLMTFRNFREHIQEPFFILSILAAILAIALLGNLTFENVNADNAQSTATGISLGCTIALSILGLTGTALAYLHYRKGGKNLHYAGICMLLFAAALFAFWSYDKLNNKSFFEARDYGVFALFFGIAAFSYVLWMHKVLGTEASIIFPLFALALLIHMTPAYTPSYADWQGKYIADLDSYFRLRNADTVYKTGFTPDRETLVYPQLPVVIHPNGTIDSTSDFVDIKFGSNVFLASLAEVLAPFGFTIIDVAMVYPGVLSVFVVLLLFFLLKELFSDMRPYNYAAAGLGALMLLLNTSFSSKAIATNCDVDTFGMFVTLGSFLLFVMAYKRKSIALSIMAGFALMFLNMSWTGYSYAVLVLGILGMAYPVINFLNKKSAVEHIPYFVIPLLISLLGFLVFHHQGETLRFIRPENAFLLPFGAMLFISFLLESVRNYANKTRSFPSGSRMEERVESMLHKYALPIFLLILVASAYYVFVISSPNNIIAYTASLVKPPIQTDIIEQTTAEQKVLCDGLSLASCLNTLRGEFGIEILFGLGMIFVLAYYMLFKGSFGASFILVWSLPMLYGVIYRSQYHFVASVPIVALGATIGLVIALNRKDLQTLRVIPSLLLVFTPILLMFTSSGMPLFGPFGGANPMYMGATGDRIFWQGTFDWLKTQPYNTVVLTWWDYGHWITAMSGKISILDGNKADRFMVKDIARFHDVLENESEALEIAKKYDSSVVVIDWTMIGKSGAPHFIATGGFGENIPLKQIGASIECVKGSDCEVLRQGGVSGSYASTTIDPNNVNNSGYMLIDMTTDYVFNSITLYLPNDSNAYRYKIEAAQSQDPQNWQTIVDKTGTDMRGTQTHQFKQVTAQYIKITGTYASTGSEFGLSDIDIFNPYYKGSYLGYGQCQFNPDPRVSTIKAVPQQNDIGGFDMVSSLYFGCNNGLGLIFEVKNGAYSASNVYVVNQGQKVPWSAWKDSSGASILGVQSMKDILGNALNYPDKYVNFPTFNTFVYVPKDSNYNFNNVMMTKLYLGDHLQEYQQAGLADASIQPAKYFTLVDGFLGDKADSSYYGYVRAYKINYPEENAA